MAFFLFFMVTLFFAFNYPSLIEKSKLSFHSKEPTHVNVNWVQRQYLTIIKKEHKELSHGHVSWENTQDYVNRKGDDALPKQLVKLSFNFKRTLKIFFQQFFGGFKFVFRLLGLVSFLLPFLIVNFFKQKTYIQKLDFNYFIVFFCFSLLYYNYFLIHSPIETRWLSSFYILLLISLMIFFSW